MTGGRERGADALALRDRLLDVQPRVAQRGGREPGGRAAHVRRCAAELEVGGHLGRGERVADAQRREAERLRERAQHDHVRVPLEQRHARDARVLVVRLVDDDRRVGVRVRERRDLVWRPQLPRRIVRVADPDQVGPLGLLDHLRPLEQAREPVDGVRRRRERGTATRREIRAGTERDQVVGAGTDHDLRRVDARVPGSGLAQLAVAPVGVLVQPREALGERHLRHARHGGCVLVVTEHLLRPQPVAARDLGRRRRPGVRAEPVRQRPRLHASSSAAACAANPSARASGSPMRRAAARSSAATSCTGLRNVSSPRPPLPRASPPVGRTCVAPAA